jgi:hypothetical protein
MEDSYNQFRKVIEARKLRQIKETEEIKHRSKEYILNKVRKDLMTTAIGNIAMMESTFGVLWGHGKTELTENERKWLARWQIIREDILDNVNKRIRSMEKELGKFEINYTGYHYNIKIEENLND